ncbi:hypothetical protein [Alteromonas confluentis]|nr:hypothetical protein [Alteromonas confluentis]
MNQPTSKPLWLAEKVKQFSSPLAGYTQHSEHRRSGVDLLLR